MVDAPNRRQRQIDAMVVNRRNIMRAEDFTNFHLAALAEEDYNPQEVEEDEDVGA